jgi:hypothetical protein
MSATAAETLLADPDWGQPLLSWSLQAVLPDAARAALDALRDQVAALAAPGAFLRTPPEALHVTAHLFVDARQKDFDKPAFWQAAGATALHETALALKGQTAFRWRFTQVRAAGLGVIALAGADPQLLRLRRHLTDAVPRAPGMAAPYGQVHCTLLRYARPDMLPADFAARVSAMPVDVEAPIRHLRLLCNRRYPSLQPEILAQYDLEDA